MTAEVARGPAALPPLSVPSGAAPGELGDYLAADGRRLRYQVVHAPHTRHRLLFLHNSPLILSIRLTGSASAWPCRKKLLHSCSLRIRFPSSPHAMEP